MALFHPTLAFKQLAWEAIKGLCFGRCADVVHEVLRNIIKNVHDLFLDLVWLLSTGAARHVPQPLQGTIDSSGVCIISI